MENNFEVKYKSLELGQNLIETQGDNNQGELRKDINIFDEENNQNHKKGTSNSTNPTNKIPMTEPQPHENIIKNKNNYNGYKRIRTEKNETKKEKNFKYHQKIKLNKSEINSSEKSKSGQKILMYEVKNIMNYDKKCIFDSKELPKQEDISNFPMLNNNMSIEENEEDKNPEFDVQQSSETNNTKERESRIVQENEQNDLFSVGNVLNINQTNQLEETLYGTSHINEEKP